MSVSVIPRRSNNSSCSAFVRFISLRFTNSLRTKIVGSNHNVDVSVNVRSLAIHSVAVVQIMIDISEATVSVEDVIKEINALDNIISVELQSIE